jgi:predicted Zn-dependent protease
MVLLDGLDEGAVEAAGRQAAELAQQATPDPDFVALPRPQPAEEVPELYDDAVSLLTVDEVVAIAASNIQAARAVAPDAILSGNMTARRTGRSSTGACSSSHVAVRTWVRTTISMWVGGWKTWP